jgi:hypothetical protein
MPPGAHLRVFARFRYARGTIHDWRSFPWRSYGHDRQGDDEYLVFPYSSPGFAPLFNTAGR